MSAAIFFLSCERKKEKENQKKPLVIERDDPAITGAQLPAECERFRRYNETIQKCDRMPQQSRDALDQAFKAMAQAWTNVDAMPLEARVAMIDGCRRGAEAFQQAAGSTCNLPQFIVERDDTFPAECIRYRKYNDAIQQCDRIPKQARDAIQQGFDAMAQGWSRNLSSSHEVIVAMADGCAKGADALASLAEGSQCTLPIVEANQDLPAECHEYRALIYKLAQCDKLPRQSVDALTQGLRSMEQGWTNLASMPPEAKKALADGCRQGSEALKQAVAATCGW